MKHIKQFLIITAFSIVTAENAEKMIKKRALQKSHEKPIALKWYESFFGKMENFNQIQSLTNLINTIASQHLTECVPVILYDKYSESSDGLLLEQLFRNFPRAFIHGQITSNYKIVSKSILKPTDKCISYILLLADVMRCKDIIGEQSNNKVIVAARSSQWRVYEFLASEVAQSFVNLLVIVKSEKTVAAGIEQPYILYTHKLYIDGIGSSSPIVLTSWMYGNLTRPDINLFPRKMRKGFAGHRFIISVAHQPPFIIKRGYDENYDLEWDGIEIRLVKLLGQIYNFTIDFREAKEVDYLGSGEAVTNEIKRKKANIGMAGLYITQDRLDNIDVSHAHSQDCASFISLTSTALPRYRAIMGPFHWTVWLSLIFIYLFAIFPLAFSDRHTLKHLIKTPEEVENMFWYVFGTFTNCFTFTSSNSWSKTNKVTTRLLIGFYWIFTIIITACYTGSIIAFVTIPVYPTTVDTAKQLLSGRYQVGTLDKGGWQYWYENSSDPVTKKLFKNIEYIPNVESGLKNTTKAFFWPYAFLGSRAQLDYIVRTNFTTRSKRSLLHIGSECFVPYGVGLIYTPNSVYKKIFNTGILRISQSGFIIKMTHDVEWEIMRTATGKLLQANYGGSLRTLSVEDRALTLDDTQGMFLLLAAGFLIGGASLLSEWLGGCFNLCKRKLPKSASSITSNPRSYDVPTPREKLDSIQYNNIPRFRLESILDAEIIENNITENNINKRTVDCIVHNHQDGVASTENRDNNASVDSDFEEEINKLFNFDQLFGEENIPDTCNNQEEIISEENIEEKQSNEKE